MATMSSDPISEHLQQFEPTQREALERTRAEIRRLLPGADEVIAYGMPSFKAAGKQIIGYQGFRGHNSLFPFSGGVVPLLLAEDPALEATKGAIRFPADKPASKALVRRMIRLRIDEVNTDFAAKQGAAQELFDNGFVKFVGKTRDGQLHGKWRWYRRDGSLMRTGSFDSGRRVGEWTTYDRSGVPVKTTRY
jgi:uncharacterized protein YdhG (YjbR/CyaY superfamily)